MPESGSVMILGALRDEIPLVEHYKRLGYKTIVVGLGTDYPCCKVADICYDVDICDKDALLRIAKEHEIRAVASNVVSIAGESVAWLAEELGLPGIGRDVAQRFLNKALMREAAAKGGVNVPPFLGTRCLQDAIDFAGEHGFPLVIKPVNGNSSKGVYRIDSIEELKLRFDESLDASIGQEGIIIEGFIKGREYIVDAYAYDRECQNTDVAFKEHFDIPERFISKSVVIQDADHCISEVERKLLEANKRTVEALGLPFGPTHGEYIYNEDEDAVYLVEIAARGGGVRLSSDLIPLATGIDVNASIAEQSLGRDPLHGSPFALEEGAAGWFAFALAPGTITAISGFDEALGLDHVIDIDMDGLEVGATARSLVNDSGKYGPIIIAASSRRECYETFEAIKDLLTIEIDGRGNGIIWE